MNEVNRSAPQPEKLAWDAPRVTDLPPLTDLTLQTVGIPGGFAGTFSYNSDSRSDKV